jgi:hypothetical protein
MGRVLSIVVVIVIIVVATVAVVILTNRSSVSGTVTETEIVQIGGWQIGHYVVFGTCTYGPSMSLNVSTFTTIQSATGLGLNTETTTITNYGVASSITTTTITNLFIISLASNCT